LTSPSRLTLCITPPAFLILIPLALRYKKGESQTNLELSNEADWEAILKVLCRRCSRVLFETLQRLSSLVLRPFAHAFAGRGRVCEEDLR
jgi:hypothetical protein